MNRTVAIGDSFRVGEVWTSPRGIDYKVTGLRMKRDAALSRSRQVADLYSMKNGQTKTRDWDAVIGWTRDPAKNLTE